MTILASPALAQLEKLTPPPSLPSLSRPPLVQHLLYENPFPVLIVLVILALAILVISHRFACGQLGRLVAGVCVLLGFGVLGLAGAVQTGREAIISQSRALVQAVAADDQPALESLLYSQARLYATRASSSMDREAILGWIDSNLDSRSPYAIDHVRVLETQARIGPSSQTGRSRVTVRLWLSQSSASAALPASTTFICMLDWRKTEQGHWRVTDISPIWLQGWGDISAVDMRR